jgi:hypothetical protein
MKTARAHRKFAIYSGFLDTILEGEEEILDGETRKDTLKRILKDLEETAAELRKEAASKIDDGPNIQTTPNAPHSIPIISRDFEKLEIAIDNAETVEDLRGLNIGGQAVPHPILKAYNKRMAELMAEPEKDFTNGLQ